MTPNLVRYHINVCLEWDSNLGLPICLDLNLKHGELDRLDTMASLSISYFDDNLNKLMLVPISYELIVLFHGYLYILHQ